MTVFEATHVFYQPGSYSIVDAAILREGQSAYTGWYSGETQEELQAKYPGATLHTWEEAKPLMEAATNLNFKEPVRRTDKESFFYMLELLPPENWVSDHRGESFMMMERTCGDITEIFARAGRDYFTLTDSCTLTHDEIMGRVEQAIKGVSNNGR
jgi:hypothetical protein